MAYGASSAGKTFSSQTILAPSRTTPCNGIFFGMSLHNVTCLGSRVFSHATARSQGNLQDIRMIAQSVLDASIFAPRWGHAVPRNGMRTSQGFTGSQVFASSRWMASLVCCFPELGGRIYYRLPLPAGLLDSLSPQSWPRGDHGLWHPLILPSGPIIMMADKEQCFPACSLSPDWTYSVSDLRLHHCH